jgi:hypothetical protein
MPVAVDHVKRRWQLPGAKWTRRWVGQPKSRVHRHHVVGMNRKKRPFAPLLQWAQGLNALVLLGTFVHRLKVIINCRNCQLFEHENERTLVLARLSCDPSRETRPGCEGMPQSALGSVVRDADLILSPDQPPARGVRRALGRPARGKGRCLRFSLHR